MIRGAWRDPNFKFRVTDLEGHDYEYFCYFSSEDSLRQRLLRDSLTVAWIRPYDFQEWKDRAERARTRTAAAVAAGKRPIPFSDAIWAELKFHLFELFHGKCAYCEGRKGAGFSGDVEHYRPKSKVDEDPTHPGYYWLAYETTNLLPSCELCNRSRGGKMTHFPVEEGTRATDPAGIPNEIPLLLNPYNAAIDPLQHLEFNQSGAALPYQNSPLGLRSKETYHLNRPGLPAERLEAIEKVRRDWSALAAILASLNRAELLGLELKAGVREYSAAQVCELKRLAAQR